MVVWRQTIILFQWLTVYWIMENITKWNITHKIDTFFMSLYLEYRFRISMAWYSTLASTCPHIGAYSVCSATDNMFSYFPAMANTRSLPGCIVDLRRKMDPIRVFVHSITHSSRRRLQRKAKPSGRWVHDWIICIFLWHGLMRYKNSGVLKIEGFTYVLFNASYHIYQ